MLLAKDPETVLERNILIPFVLVYVNDVEITWAPCCHSTLANLPMAGETTLVHVTYRESTLVWP